MEVSYLTELSVNEAFAIEGGGAVSLFLSCIGLAVSPAVACLNPVAGIALATTSAGVFYNNLPNR